MLPIQNYVFSQYRKCAAKREIEFHLTADQFLAIAGCACVYCGVKDSNTAIRNQYAVKVWSYNGVDRVNSDLPYEPSNTVACCKACNAAKSDQTLVVFLASEWLANRIQQVKGN